MAPETIDPRTPVLVGAGVADQRRSQPEAGVGELELMARAVEDAADGLGPLLGAVGHVLVPRGTWRHGDPGRWLAERFGFADAHTTVAELGVLQQTLITRACTDIASGAADVVLVVGGEAAYRRLRARIGRVELVDPAAEGTPDTTWAPGADILARVEIDRHLAVPARQYAVMESAIAAAEGRTPVEDAHAIADLWAGFSRVADEREGGGVRGRAIDPAELVAPEGRNAWLASPYTKWHCSQMNVDQAAALILCSAETARRFGVARDRWVFPHAAAEANTMVPLAARPDLGRSPGFAAVGAALGASDVAYRDLYSCFPAAVRVQQRELGLQDVPGHELTRTGGMAFAGGPLNNYVLQATAALVADIRTHGGDGLVTSVSGMITKQAGALWSSRPTPTGFRALDVSADLPAHPVDPDLTGQAEVVGCTVAFDRTGTPELAVVVVENPDGVRSVASSTAQDIMTSMRHDTWVGRTVELSQATFEA